MINLQNIPTIHYTNQDGASFLKQIPDNSVDLVLTDPPYIISRNTGMNELYNNVSIGENLKTEEDWKKYKKENHIENDDKKDLYIKYGSIYGKKYAVKTDYGDWDNNFTLDELGAFVKEYYKKLRNGGTIIIFFDLWKLTALYEILKSSGFQQIRFIEWIKTNPQPLNSSTNYLTNCREIALLGVKKGKPTFNSKYDNGIYSYPLQGGKHRFHPTQKSIHLFEDLIKKHSNEGDIVLDTFLGSGTTAVACSNTNRRFIGCEVSSEYFEKIKTRFG
jgi:site-specific DNA-methyltransferase (adenine-specific)